MLADVVMVLDLSHWNGTLGLMVRTLLTAATLAAAALAVLAAAVTAAASSIYGARFCSLVRVWRVLFCFHE